MKFFLLAVLFFAYVQGGCYDCSTESGLSCVSRNKFQVCINNVRKGKIHTCPEGTVCSSTGNLICIEPGSDIIQTCADTQCDETNTFACTGLRTFVLCFGSAVPSEVEGSCKPNEECNINNPHICENATTIAEDSDYDDIIVPINPPENTHDSNHDNIAENLEETSVEKPPATEPPVAEPPVTQPPVTEPPVVTAPITPAPVTTPLVTEPATKTSPEKTSVNTTTIFSAKISITKGGVTKLQYRSNKKVIS